MAADFPLANPPNFATLAKRICRWTTNSLVTLLILVAGLGFGRQVLIWWAGDALPPVTLPADALGDPMQLHSIQFGDSSWLLCRQSIVGDKQKAVEGLRAASREALGKINGSAGVLSALHNRGDRTTKTEVVVPDMPARDGQFLKFLSNAKPVDEEPGKWRLYEFHEAMPMAVGLMRSDDRDVAPPTELGADLAQSGYRVVLWALAMPTGASSWTLCSFQPGGGQNEAVSGLGGVLLPPDARKGLSLRAQEAEVIAFHGSGRTRQWQQFFDDWFQSHGWRAVAPWQPAGEGQYAKFTPPGGGVSVDVRFGPNGRGDLSGLLMIVTAEAR